MAILDRMVRRRRFKLAYLLGSLLLLTASLHAPTAYSAPGDPPSGSPAGSVYELPLEQGRADGAPKGGGGTGFSGGGESTDGGSGSASGGAPGQSEAGSLYRTENNFGSSSRVPGLAATDTRSSGSSAGGAGAAAGGTAGSGSGASRGAIAGGAVAAETADTGNTSIPAGLILLGGIGLLAVAVGIFSRRFSRG